MMQSPIEEENTSSQQHQDISTSQPKSGPNKPKHSLLGSEPREQYLEIGVPLYEAAIRCDWKAADDIFKKKKELELIRYSITENGETALHVAASAKVPKKVEEFVENLVELMTKEDLELVNDNHNTALYLAAAAGNIKTVKIMMEKNEKLLSIPGGGSKKEKPKMMPLYTAAVFGNHEVVKYMYEKSNDLKDSCWTPETRGWLLEKCVENNMFDIALKIVKTHENLTFNGKLLGILAGKPEAFSVKSYNFMWRFIIWVFAFIGVTLGAPDNEGKALPLLKNIWGAIAKKPKIQIDNLLRGSPDVIKDKKSASGWAVQGIQLQNLISTHVSEMKDETLKIMGGSPDSVTKETIPASKKVDQAQKLEKQVDQAQKQDKQVDQAQKLEKQVDQAQKLEKHVDQAQKLEKQVDQAQKQDKQVDQAQKLEKQVDQAQKQDKQVDQAQKLEKQVDQAQKLEKLISEHLVTMHRQCETIVKGPIDSIKQDKGDQALKLQKLIYGHISDLHEETRKIIKREKYQPKLFQELILKHTEKLQKETDNILHSPPKVTYSSRVVFIAAEMGNTNFLIELIRQYPDLIWKLNDDNQSIFHIAVEHCHEGIYNLLYEIGAMKDMITPLRDTNDNNMLHLVGKSAKKKQLEDVSGVALQMQRQLLWFQEVKNMIPLSYRERKNQDDLTPHELFTKDHKELVTQGEKWMKGTASQCMVVAALIATIVFAAAFTVPGGYHQDNGIPIFHSQATFMVFVVADAISLFASSASILMFLSILTSRYAERDFLDSLPTKLMLGLVTLFLSITTMTVAFCVSFFVLYHKGLLWMPILIAVFGLMPVFLYVWLQYSLFWDVIRSTFRSRYLFKPKKRVLYYENPKV